MQLTRRGFLGRVLGAAAVAFAAPAALAACVDRPPARVWSAYDLAKMERFARMYGASAERISYVLMTGRQVGKTINILEVQKALAGRGRSFFVPVDSAYQLVEVDFQDMEARILAHAQQVEST